eukprot:TRINITY_DN8217_c0_g1_i4.p2 TRINITY_DN8217_c0_g1~~TRINITY_DN8217_c0_g1_i4.p2  ORF type:complete len:111 (+),score=14.70 TRINITY_DN8217_c0_g1_i4:213-545(+)
MPKQNCNGGISQETMKPTCSPQDSHAFAIFFFTTKEKNQGSKATYQLVIYGSQVKRTLHLSILLHQFVIHLAATIDSFSVPKTFSLRSFKESAFLDSNNLSSSESEIMMS